MSGLLDTCPPAALGVTFETLELSGGSEHAVGFGDHLRCQGSCGEMLHSPRGGDLRYRGLLVPAEPGLGAYRSIQTPGVNICQPMDGRGGSSQADQLG